MKYKGKILAVFCALLLWIPFQLNYVQAQQTGSITVRIVYEDGERETSISNVPVCLVQTAVVTENNGVLEASFLDPFSRQASTLPTTHADQQQLAQAFVNLAKQMPDTVRQAVTDTNGMAVFAGLDPGIYLVYQEKDAGNGYAPFDPYLVTLPEQSADGWNYVVESMPKTALTRQPEQPVTPRKPQTPKTVDTGVQSGAAICIAGLLLSLGLLVILKRTART